MATKKVITIDGNEAAASSAYRMSEVIAIYPITPSSPMGEFSDAWATYKKPNVWGIVPDITEMQSEGGASGAVHGALQAGSLTTTFTASQGLLLMIPNMYKIAGELTSFCMHVSARTVATHALSIFGDHSDVMACRQTGFAMTASGSIQEIHDMAAISHAATLETRVPFLHFFDGFRSSHELSKIQEIPDEQLRELIKDELVKAHRDRALTPDRPLLRGTAQNPDTFFQAREACNTFYDKCPQAVQKVMDEFAKITGRQYHLFDYVGAPDAEKVIVMMGSGAEAAHEYIDWAVAKGEKVGLIKIRLYRPFYSEAFLKALPKTVKKISVLDRTKEPGALGEPLYLDVLTALQEAQEMGTLTTDSMPMVRGGRYGLSSKEFNPAMVKGVFDELGKDKPKNHFTIGIQDDVTKLSLDYDPDFSVEPDDVVRAVFYGLGSDGTVGANKNSIKIIGEGTDLYAQGYFVYDSKKSGAMTTSHLRFGPRPIQSTYLVNKASFVACHQPVFLEKTDVLKTATKGGTFLLNTAYSKDEVWAHLPLEIQTQIKEKELKFYVIDAYKVAKDAGMGLRINTIMQTCFFAISGVLPKDVAIQKIKDAIEKTYSKRGAEVVKRNFAAVDMSLEHMFEATIPSELPKVDPRPPIVPKEAPDFMQRVTSMMMSDQGDLLPVSAFPVDGTYDTGTTKWEKRNLALDIPAWDASICIQCNKCVLSCPHAAIRSKIYEPTALEKAPTAFQSVDFRGKDFPNQKLTIQVAPEDCTGCKVCVMVCPAKDKSNPKHKALNMVPQPPVRDQEVANYDFFLSLPEVDRTKLKLDVKGSQFMLPLFEYSGACAGCGETPYVKLVSQLFGDRALIGNATGCSSIYGGNLPTTPYAKDANGRGPAWSNSLFEDNAEFAMGFRLAVDFHKEQAQQLLQTMGGKVGDELVQAMISADQSTEEGIAAQRERVEILRKKIGGESSSEAKRLNILADYLVKKSVWAFGGDGWAYDIGYGGLDHVLASGRDVNVLVMDTEVYSNTGGQQSKATPIGAVAKFASAGKELGKKDLGAMAMTYGHVYVAQVAMGAKDAQTVKAFVEAESYDGPSLIIAYSHCIAHGYDLSFGPNQQKMAVDSGIWPLYRFDPRRIKEGKAPLQLDSPAPRISAMEYMQNETRFRMAEKVDPKRFKELVKQAGINLSNRYALYKHMASLSYPTAEESKESN